MICRVIIYNTVLVHLSYCLDVQQPYIYQKLNYKKKLFILDILSCSYLTHDNSSSFKDLLLIFSDKK